MSNYQYTPKTDKDLRSWFSNKKSTAKTSGLYQITFTNADAFISWYRAQDKRCHYCELTEETSQEICHKGLLTSNRFPKGGAFKQGVNRAYFLEIDRRNPKGDYSPENCVLACYWCNNDKSDVFSEEQYIQFLQNRVGFLQKLLTEN